MTVSDRQQPQPAAAPPVLFADLDGTVRRGKDELGRFVNTPDDVVIFPGALEQMRAWRAAGGVVIGVTNQGGVGDGHITADAHRAICERTVELCDGQLDEIVACTHPTAAQCWCRKPLPGLIFGALEAVVELPGHPGGELDRLSCLMVGDRPEDRGAALAAGVPFLWASDWRAGRR